MSWSFLTQLLDEISNHSTFLGKIWLTLFMVFRIVLTVVGGKSIYSDEQSTFHCNTQQPGCENICYDAFAPLSHARFWIFQIIMIATPTIMYLGFALHKIAHMNDDEYGSRNRKHKINRDDEEAEDEEDPVMMDEILLEKEKAPRHDGRRRIKRDGLMTVYVTLLLSRVVFEVGFLFGQYVLYGFKVDPVYVCEGTLCRFKLDCFVSRPTEKTAFLLIMYAVSSVCLLVTVLELLHLCIGGISDRHTRVSQQRDAMCRQMPVAPPVHHTALNKHTLAMGIKPDYDLESSRESFGDGWSTRDIHRLRKHLKRVQQHLDMVYQKSERSPSRSNSPESNATAFQQNRLNFTQKHRRACENGLFV